MGYWPNGSKHVVGHQLQTATAQYERHEDIQMVTYQL